MKLGSIKKVVGKIVLKSGLHIGSGNTEMHIGGTDNPVIKHPHTLHPYIPGSSLKGKVRSLLELESGLMIYTDGDVVSEKVLNKIMEDKNIDEIKKTELKKKCENIIKVFGSGSGEQEGETLLGPTRVSFSDCHLNQEWLKKAEEKRYSLTEFKSENVIDRIRGTAQHPRFIERVPAGAEFDFMLTFKVFEGDEDLYNLVIKGLKLLEMDAIGGNSSRGYGRFKFEGEIAKEIENIKVF
ncbi:MAG: type III-A CRISPR-associated RAMP protein Csm3 [Endomicrobiia bacterium]